MQFSIQADLAEISDALYSISDETGSSPSTFSNHLFLITYYKVLIPVRSPTSYSYGDGRIVQSSSFCAGKKKNHPFLSQPSNLHILSIPSRPGVLPLPKVFGTGLFLPHVSILLIQAAYIRSTVHIYTVVCYSSPGSLCLPLHQPPG